MGADPRLRFADAAACESGRQHRPQRRHRRQLAADAAAARADGAATDAEKLWLQHQSQLRDGAE